MMNCSMRVFIIFCLLSLTTATPRSQQDYGLCSQVYVMHQYCTSQTSPALTGVTRKPAVQPRVGKSGPVGPPGIVNYTAIEEKIATKYLDLEAKIVEKFEILERIVVARLDRGDTEIAKTRNETTKSCEENGKNLEATINERFEKLERIVVARLERGDTENEETRNETTKNSKSTEENRKRTYTFSSCDEVPRTEHESWEGKGGIMNVSRTGRFYEVYCDMTTDGGGWTVFQRRMDGSVDFYRTWEKYAEGFGNKSGEFWFGLEAVYQLTQDGAYELRVDLTDWDGNTAYAKYGTFSISGRSDNYRLTVGQYSGTAGDSLTYHNNQPFSAKNKDLNGNNCATTIGAAWWFHNCAYSSLNGRYNDTSDIRAGVCWHYWKKVWHYSLKGSEMKFRKK